MINITIRSTVMFQPEDPQAINIYNLLVRRLVYLLFYLRIHFLSFFSSFETLGYCQVARNFYDPSRCANIAQYE